MRKCRQKGFTLLEAVLAMTVLAVLASMAVPMLGNSVRAYNESADIVQVLSKLRVASERLAREIRQVRADPLLPGSYDISVPLNAGNLSFIKTDGETVTISNAMPLITLEYQSTGNYTLTDQLNTLAFTYLQADGISTATGASDIAFVEFELVLTHNGNDYPQRSRVALRNLP